MDYSAANTALWNVIIQLSMIAAAILAANFLRRTISFIRGTMLPVAVLGGFLLLIVKHLGLVHIDYDLMEHLVYHGIALGFIAMSLRTPVKGTNSSEKAVGFSSGAVIVSTYMIQGAVGLIITIGLGLTVMPKMFKAAGLLLPMGFGQGPGQANNIGSTYQALGFSGGHNFGLAIAAAGYLVACVAGVIMLNILRRQGKIHPGAQEKAEKYSVDYFYGDDEQPISASIDKLSVQLAMTVLVYLAAYLLTRGLTTGIAHVSEGVAATLNTLLWGFNFIIGSALAILLRVILEKCKKQGLIKRRYQNNYLLNRLSGAFFDIMIVAGIACIDINGIRELLLPFILLIAAGAVVTWFHLRFVCRKVYGDYYYEGLLSMYGMLTGTISSGVLLLREIDPDFTTPAVGNLITGSSFGILLGAPVLVLVGIAPKSDVMCLVTLALVVIYLLILDVIVLKVGREKHGSK